MYLAKSLLLVTLAALAWQAQVHAAGVGTCACQLGGEGGSNPCGCSELVVRPPPRIRPAFAGPRLVVTRVEGAQQFQPVGDVCTCSRTHVEPAVAPRPRCTACLKGKGGLPQLLAGSGPRTLADETPVGCTGGSGALFGGLEQAEASQPRQADPVSMSIAYGQAQQAASAVREEVIMYGPRRLPLDGFVRKQPKNVPEEGLLIFNSPVVELKPTRPRPCSSRILEEEARDALLRAEQEALEAALEQDGVVGPHAITYSDLGYLPEAERHPTFIREHGCAGHTGSLVIPENSPTYTVPLPSETQQGRVVVTNYDAEDEEAGDREDSYAEDGDASVETGATSGAFVPAAVPRPCGSVLVDRLAASISGCGGGCRGTGY